MLRVVVMVVALIVGLVVGLPAAGEISGEGQGVAGGAAPPDDESSAIQRARELGEPVEIRSRRTFVRVLVGLDK
ncbi:hypothetical protein [Nonomuraea jiangxiensis]|nr:hypothetical protein [Nonomuraea jiangxiensis]